MRVTGRAWRLLALLLIVSVCLWKVEHVQAMDESDHEADANEEEEEDVTTVAPDSQESIEKKYLAIEEGFKNVVNSLLKRALPHVLEASNNAELSPACMGSFLKIIGKMRNLDREVFRSRCTQLACNCMVYVLR